MYNSGYDPHWDRYEESPLEKVKQQYWTAKQTIMSKLGKKEDESLVASDAELDAKLAVFGSIRATSENLLRCIERYQDYIGDLAHEENALGRFLKSRGKSDKTEAGKLMASVGRAQSYTAHQRLALRVPLVRLYQELEVFNRRAVMDCQATVEGTLKARNEYRGSLLRMKDVSQQLDPDTYKQMEKFRNVQAQVRKNKARFDKLKLDCLQKIDLLAASRCNLFSQVLTNYHSCLMRFWDKSARAHHTISESFKGTHRYAFTVIKDLAEPPVEEDPKDKANDEQLIVLGEMTRSDSLEGLFKDSPTHEKTEPKEGVRLDEALGDWNECARARPDLPPDSSVDFVDQLLAGVSQDVSENSFTRQWQQAFGTQTNAPSAPVSTATMAPAAGDAQLSQKRVMPSQLLDLQSASVPHQPSFVDTTATGTTPVKMGKANAQSTQRGHRAAWFDLFADIDPLQNPDALGKPQKDDDRGC